MQLNSNALLDLLPGSSVFYFDREGRNIPLKDANLDTSFEHSAETEFKKRYQKAWEGETFQWQREKAGSIYLETVKVVHNNGEPFGIHISQKIDSYPKKNLGERLNSLVQTVLEVSFQPTLILDEKLQIFAANSLFKTRFHGLLPEILEGTPLLKIELLSKGQMENLSAGKVIADQGQVFQSLAGFKVHDENLFFEMSLKTLQGLDTKMYLLNLYDVTDNERSRAALTESQLALEKQNQELEEMAFMISHNLRAPVANMTYLITLLERSRNEMEREDLYNAFKQSTTQVLGTLDIIGESLNVRRGSNLHFQTVQIDQMIHGILEEFGDLISQSKVEVKVDIYDDRKNWMVPKETLHAAIREAVSNSLRYRNPRRPLRITILCYRRNGERLIEITDNGLGINMERNGHKVFGLFQTFHRHKDARGVGLFPLKNQLAAFGGDVTLDSEEGRGTTLTLNFRSDE